MVEILENRPEQPTPSTGAQFTPDLRPGKEQFKGGSGAQALVEAKLGGGVISKDSIDFHPVSTVMRSEFYVNNGCMTIHGGNAEEINKGLEAQGTDALNNQPALGSAEAQDPKEQALAHQMAQDTIALANGDDDKIQAIQQPLTHLNKEETQRVINSANKELAQTQLKYGQTQDGAVWLGAKKDDGTYQATEYMRPPECSAS